MINPELTRAVVDVLNERFRQVHEKGHSRELDDRLTRGQLVYEALIRLSTFRGPSRRDLIETGALILAEIERLDRAAAANAPGPDPAGIDPAANAEAKS